MLYHLILHLYGSLKGNILCFLLHCLLVTLQIKILLRKPTNYYVLFNDSAV